MTRIHVHPALELEHPSNMRYSYCILYPVLPARQIVKCAIVCCIIPLAIAGCVDPGDAIKDAVLARNCKEVVRAISGGADINAPFEDGITALMLGAVGPEPDFVQCLLQHGADSNLADNTGKTALMYAIEPAVVQLLVDAGADVNAQDQFGRTPLMHAQRPGTVRILLDSGADPYIRDNDGRNMFDRDHWEDIREILNEYEAATVSKDE